MSESNKQSNNDITSLLSNWQSWMKNEKLYSSHTVESYLIDVAMFLTFLQNHLNHDISSHNLKEVSPQIVRSWLTKLKGNNYKATSYARYLAALKNFFNYLKKFEKIPIQDLSLVRIKTQRRSLPKALNITDAMYALQETTNISKNTWVQLRDYALLTLLYGCGLRISEALSINATDLHSEYLRIKGKGNKERSVPILSDVKAAISKYLDHCPYKPQGANPIFVGERGKPLQSAIVQKQIRKIRTNLGLSNSVTPHTFRHSFATHLLTNGADLRSIQELLGHKNLDTTEIYTNLDAKKLLSVYGQTHPRSKASQK